MKTRSFVALLALCQAGLGCSALVDLDPLTNGGGGGAGGGLPNGVVEVGDDAFAGEFELGTSDDLLWSGDRFVLDPAHADGLFRSRVFDAGAPVTWTSLSWMPGAPYWKELPGQGAKESGYPAGSIDMADNALLLHLDGTGTLLAGGASMDASGKGVNAFVDAPAGGGVEFVDGAVGQGARDDATTYLFASTQPLDFGEGDFTWAIWASSTGDCVGNAVFLGADDGATGPHLWLGCSPAADSSNCGPGAAAGRAAGTFKSEHTEMGDGGGFCGTSQINDGAFHHLAIVKKGHAPSTLTLYVDGVAEANTTATFGHPITFATESALAIGAFTGGTYQAEGDFDEVSIWKRALSADEITSIYRRGGSRLWLRVRGCTEPDCSDEPLFVGPPGMDVYMDPAGALGPPTDLPLSLPKTQYFQYEADFATLHGGVGPELLSVKARGQR